jgi:dTDP-L-rhamnose 4-epimerase
VILVTGGCGFIGSHVVDALVELGAGVRVLDNLLPLAHGDVPPSLNPAAEYVQADLTDGEDVRRCLADVDAVAHLASMVGLGVDLGDIVDYVEHNDLGTAVLIRELALRGDRTRFVLASSMVVYGEGRYRCLEHGVVRPAPRERAQLEAKEFEPACPRCGGDVVPEPVPEEAPLEPRNVYAATKLHQEHLCAAYGRETGAPVTALRLHNVYGARMPRDTPYAGVASIFRSALEAGDAPRVFEDGRQLRDFVHVRDVADAFVRAVTSEPAVSGAFNVASGEPRSVGDMATALAAGFADAPPPVVTGEYRLGDVRHVFASPERAAERLGFQATVSFADGMREFAGAPLRS